MIHRSKWPHPATIAALLLLSSCTAWKMAWHNYPDVDDYRLFPARDLSPAPVPFHFAEAGGARRMPAAIIYHDAVHRVDSLLDVNGTLGFLVIIDDTLRFEGYWNGHAASDLVLSFSLAKPITSILVGCAIQDGIIRSVRQPVTDFVPELAANGYSSVTIEHLLQMTSGMDYTESFNPFGLHPRMYYGDGLEEKMLSLELKEQPGTRFEYRSGEYQLLGLILARALHPRTITQYTQERLLHRVGTEYAGVWNLDHEGGLEKTFCCAALTARDYAKLGRLYLHRGNWDGDQVLPSAWIEQSTRIDTSAGSAWNFQYAWWLLDKYSREFLGRGSLGQFIYVDPDRSAIVVRIGDGLGGLSNDEWVEVFRACAGWIKSDC